MFAEIREGIETGGQGDRLSIFVVMETRERFSPHAFRFPFVGREYAFIVYNNNYRSIFRPTHLTVSRVSFILHRSIRFKLDNNLGMHLRHNLQTAADTRRHLASHARQ